MPYEYLESAVLSDPGRVRKTNEDSVLSLPGSGVFCVADGMGGAACGEVASAWAVEEIRKAFEKPSGGSRTAKVRKALNRASSRIKTMSEERGSAGTGTTAVVLLFDDRAPGRAVVLHAGDSRAYRLRRGKLECVTTDHSMAAAAGVKHEKALPAMFRGVVTRAVGLENEVDLEETPLKLEKKDLYLLCSDGLSKMLPDRKMQKMIQSLGDADLRVICRQLVEAANNAGGEDNISVALVRIAGDLPAAVVEPAEDVEEASTSETALEVPTPVDGEDDSAEDYAGHTPDSTDSLVGVTPGTSETTPAGVAGVAKDAGIPPSAPAASPEAHSSSAEAVTPETDTRAPEAESRMIPDAGSSGSRGASRGLPFKVGAIAVVLLIVAAILLVFSGRKPSETQEPGGLVEREPPVQPAPAATEYAPPAEPDVAPAGAVPPVNPGPAAAPVPEPEPAIEDESPELAPSRPVDSGVPPAGPEERVITDESGAEAQPVAAAEPEPESGPAQGEEAATVSPEAMIDELAPRLAGQMPRSLTTGSWGDVLAMLGPVEQHLDLAKERVDGLRNSLVWAEEWKKAGSDRAYAARNLDRYTEVVSQVLAAMGYSEIPGGRPELDALGQETADAYCRELFRLRQVLVSRLRALVSQMQQQSAILGDNPDRTLTHLHVFLATSAENNRAAAAAWKESITGLETWLAEDSDRLIPLVGIMKGPPQLVPRAMECRRKMWSGLIGELENGRGAVEKWKQRKGRTAELIRIERTLATIVRRYQAGRGDAANLNWPLEEDLRNMEALLADITDFMGNNQRESL